MNARAINLSAELNNLPGLTGRTPDTPDCDLEGKAFGPTYDYRDGFISTVRFSGLSAWERHAGDEILLIAEGDGFLHLIDDEGWEVPRSLSTNLMIVVPANTWHRIQSSKGIALVTITPQPTTHRAERP